MPETLEIKLGNADLDVSQYFGMWAVEQSRFRQMLARLQGVDLAAHIAANQDRNVSQPSVERLSEGSPSGTANQAVIAVLSIDGVMTKRGSSFGAAGSVYLRKEIRQAVADPGVDAILLVIDSPGGTVAGTADLAAEIKAASTKKPVYAQIEDCCCSAAYWVASQATKVYANDRTAIVGSIGTYLGLYDESEKFAADGIKPVLIATGEHKGAGFPGTEITDNQRAHFQGVIDQTQQSFADAVSSGRQLSAEEVEQLATGKVWLADQATQLGLIDGIQSRDTTLHEVASEVSNAKGAKQMAAATYEELKTECVGADPRFLCSQLDTKAELADARRNWMAEQNRRIQAAKLKAEEEEEEPEAEDDEEPKEKRSKKSSKSKAKSKRKGKAEEEDDEMAEDDEEPESEDDEEPEAEDDEEEPEARHRSRNKARKYGVKHLPNGRGSKSFTDPISLWDSSIAAKVKAGMDRKRAVAAVVRENPGLREAYVAAYNASQKRK